MKKKHVTFFGKCAHYCQISLPLAVSAMRIHQTASLTSCDVSHNCSVFWILQTNSVCNRISRFFNGLPFGNQIMMFLLAQCTTPHTHHIFFFKGLCLFETLHRFACISHLCHFNNAFLLEIGALAY